MIDSVKVSEDRVKEMALAGHPLAVKALDEAKTRRENGEKVIFVAFDDKVYALNTVYASQV